MTSATEYKATYSPGPWHTVPAPSRQSMAAIRMANGEAIAFVNRRPNAAANARLLEAAPDMLELIRRLVLALEAEYHAPSNTAHGCNAHNCDAPARALLARIDG